jgi:tRNA A-37 threonylcarbamoyl transferase component Bud32
MMDHESGSSDQPGFVARTEREAAIVAQLSARYEFLRTLGKGGFASVYKVRNRALDRVEALKVLSDELTSDHEFLERFSVEARICASFSNPNIVTIFELQRVDRFFYFTMQHVDGPPLSRFVKPENRLPEARVVEITTQVADAIQYAHDKGVIHRDIKPDNILLDPEGVPYVTDFGIAKSDRGLTQTRTGLFLGSPYYASPEQSGGLQMDGRTDIYSLGVTLYALLSSRHPHEGENAVSIMAKKLTEDPMPLSFFNPDVDPRLVAVIDRALDRDPERRFQQANDMAEALRSVADDELPTVRTDPAAAPLPETAPAPATENRPRWFAPTVAAALLAVVAGGIGWIATDRAGHPGDEARQPLEARSPTPDVELPTAVVSPDPQSAPAAVETTTETGSRVDDLLDVAEQLMAPTATRDDLLLAKAKIDEALDEDDDHPRALKLALTVKDRLDDLARRRLQQQRVADRRAREQLEAEIQKLKTELGVVLAGLEADLASRHYERCTEAAMAARTRIESRPTSEQSEYIELKERVLDIYHRAREGKERRDSQLAEVGRIEELIDGGSLASASTAVDLLLSKPDLEPEVADRAATLRDRIKTLWNERRNVPDAFGEADHSKKKKKG